MKNVLVWLAAAAVVGVVGGHFAAKKTWDEVKVKKDQLKRMRSQVKEAESSRMDLKRSNAVQERNQAADILRYSRSAAEERKTSQK